MQTLGFPQETFEAFTQKFISEELTFRTFVKICKKYLPNIDQFAQSIYQEFTSAMKEKGIHNSSFFSERTFVVKSASIVMKDGIVVTVTTDQKHPGCLSLENLQKHWSKL